jgi:hypothetical protein
VNGLAFASSSRPLQKENLLDSEFHLHLFIAIAETERLRKVETERQQKIDEDEINFVSEEITDAKVMNFCVSF